MAEPVRVLGIVGSLRTASYNGALLRAAVELAPPQLAIEPFSGLAEFPLFNQDIEDRGDPAPIAALRAALRDADALLIASPEYNYGVPGVLKNAIDWISRPAGRSPFPGKPAAIMGASQGPSGTMRMQPQLRVTLQAVGMAAMPKPDVAVSFCKDKFDPEGRLIDVKTREHLTAFMAAFAEWIGRF
jgi:chromate reductase, NAD(P)H dehydrogenase (quinone)